jgi:hypothetical protein
VDESGTTVRRIGADRLISTTMAMLTVLIVFDGWHTLDFWQVVGVIVGPLVAILLSHIFGEELGYRVDLGRRLTRHERRQIFVTESRLLLLALPPLVILVVLTAAHVSYIRIVQVIIFTGVLSLGVWGFVAGRRAELTGWGLAASTAYGFFLGAVILALRAILQPGTL